MSNKQSEPLPDIKWIVLVSLSIVVMLLIVGMGQSAKSGALAALPDLPTFDSPIGNPALDLDKTVDDVAPQPGDTIDYTLAYANTESGSQAFNVRLYDFLPAGVEYLSASQIPDVNVDGILIFTAPSVGPGTTPTSITVSVRVLSGYESLYNQALVTADGVTPTADSLLLNTIAATDHLTLTKEGDTAVLLGGEIAYTLHCENTGPVTYNNVELIDVLPPGATLVDASIPPLAIDLPVVKWAVGSLGSGMSWNVALTATAPTFAGLITNTASLNAPTHASVQALHGTTVIVEGPILELDKYGKATAAPGDELVYTLTYGNSGSDTATNIVLTDTLPSDVTVTGTDPNPTTTIDRQWSWEIATLAPAASASIVITTTVNEDAEGTLYNAAMITAPDAWPAYASLHTEIRNRIYLPLVMRAFATP